MTYMANCFCSSEIDILRSKIAYIMILVLVWFVFTDHGLKTVLQNV